MRRRVHPPIDPGPSCDHLLGQVSRRITGDREPLYVHLIYCLGIFADPARFHGAYYRAANCISLGHTASQRPDACAESPIKETLG